MTEEKKDAVGNLGLSGYIKVYPSSRSVGTVVKKSAQRSDGVRTPQREVVAVNTEGK